MHPFAKRDIEFDPVSAFRELFPPERNDFSFSTTLPTDNDRALAIGLMSLQQGVPDPVSVGGREFDDDGFEVSVHSQQDRFTGLRSGFDRQSIPFNFDLLMFSSALPNIVLLSLVADRRAAEVYVVDGDDAKLVLHGLSGLLKRAQGSSVAQNV